MQLPLCSFSIHLAVSEILKDQNAHGHSVRCFFLLSHFSSSIPSLHYRDLAFHPSLLQPPPCGRHVQLMSTLASCSQQSSQSPYGANWQDPDGLQLKESSWASSLQTTGTGSSSATKLASVFGPLCRLTASNMTRWTWRPHLTRRRLSEISRHDPMHDLLDWLVVQKREKPSYGHFFCLTIKLFACNCCCSRWLLNWHATYIS